MLFGSKALFAVECYHEPRYPNDRGWVFGRMCAWCRGVELGDLSEPDCMLNVTEGCFQDCLGQLDSLRDPAVDSLPDGAAFRRLEAAIYGDDDRTTQEVYADAVRFRKFEFLTSWGQSFDRVSAFLHDAGDEFRVLYRLRCGTQGSARVTREQVERPLLAFLEWMAIEKHQVPRDERKLASDSPGE
ncbi:MAG TPA: hypothetical protein VM529_14025 [Gemmata sp.]|jgi:hypothetical protein|nr:hypothetical protein [Gemmata sp.]